MAAVIGGELGPGRDRLRLLRDDRHLLEARDYERASEWTEATLRWCERQSVPAFPGICRIHRAESDTPPRVAGQGGGGGPLGLRGAPRFNFFSGLGPANYEVGEARRRLGDLRGARGGLRPGPQYGFSPGPGLSLIRLAQGKGDAAASGISRRLSEATGNRCRGQASRRTGRDRPGLGGRRVRGVGERNPRRHRGQLPGHRPSRAGRRGARGGSTRPGGCPGALADLRQAREGLAGGRRPYAGRARCAWRWRRRSRVWGRRMPPSWRHGRRERSSSRWARARPQRPPAGCWASCPRRTSAPSGSDEPSCSPTS